jgi:hypothetical protein
LDILYTENAYINYMWNGGAGRLLMPILLFALLASPGPSAAQQGHSWQEIDLPDADNDGTPDMLQDTDTDTIDGFNSTDFLAGDWWDDSGSDIYNLNPGGVGIGTPIPAARLDVAGNLLADNLRDVQCPGGKIMTGFDASGHIICADWTHLYLWRTSSWSGCSNACGPGTETRSVWCEREDGTVVEDSYCGSGKPEESQGCCTPGTAAATCTSGRCGVYPDSCGCDTAVDCGKCEGGICRNGLCCIPDTCTSGGYGCGDWGNGCGGIIRCGDCGSHAYCLDTGTCECDSDQTNCNNDWSDGCEINLMTDSSNCGSCGVVCGKNSYCSNGNCVCKSGYEDCSRNGDCECYTQSGEYVCHEGVCRDAAQLALETGCSNGIRDGDEQGVDCGGSCPEACIFSCTNGIRDGDEQGVDCGGSCLELCYSSIGEIDNCFEDAAPGNEAGSSLYTLYDPVVQQTAPEALQEYADARGISVNALDTPYDYMDAVAYYVDKHTTYMKDPETKYCCRWYEIYGVEICLEECIDSNEAMPANDMITSSGQRGCGNDYCGDCEDYSILRGALLRSLGVDWRCVFSARYINEHSYNIVLYKGAYRIMDYGLMGSYFYDRWDQHHAGHVWNDRLGGYDSPSISPATYTYNYPNSPGCPASEWTTETYYKDVCPEGGDAT